MMILEGMFYEIFETFISKSLYIAYLQVRKKRIHLRLFLIHFGLKIYYLIDRSTIISRIKIYQFMFEQQMIKTIVALLKINRRFDRCVTRLNAKEKKKTNRVVSMFFNRAKAWKYQGCMHRDVCRNVERTGTAAPAVAINERKVRPSD